MTQTGTVEAPESDQVEHDRPMRADARRNYERLVVAARKVFAEEGGQASMEAIAREAGVGVGTLYRHFPKRIDVVEAVYRTDVEQLVQTAERVVAELEPWEAVVAFLEAFVRYAQGKRTFLNELREAFEKNPDLRSQCRERIDCAMNLVFSRGAASRRCPHRHRRLRRHAAGRPDVHERNAVGRSVHPVAGNDPRRTPQGAVAEHLAHKQ